MATRTSTETLNTIYATTYKLRRKGIFDQVMLATPFWMLMQKNKRRLSETGGRSIEVSVRRSKNQTITSIGRGESVSLSETDPLTVVEFQWRTITGHILRYRDDVQKNRGQAAIGKMVTEHIDNLSESTIQEFEEMLFSDGTGNGGKDINGLLNLVANDPTTGTVAGVDRSTEAWFRNQTYNATGLTVSVNLLKRMRNMHNTCGQYTGKQRFPDFWVTTQVLSEAYEAEVEEVARVYTGDRAMADLGFGELTFKGRIITWSPTCPDYSMYALNSATLGFTVDPAYNMVLGQFERIPDQPEDAIAHQLTICNLTINRPRGDGVIYNLGN